MRLGRALAILAGAALAAAPATAGTMTVRNCAETIVTVELRDAPSADGPVTASTSLADGGATWNGSCATERCWVRASFTLGSSQILDAGTVCVHGARVSTAYTILVVPAHLCRC